MQLNRLVLFVAVLAVLVPNFAARAQQSPAKFTLKGVVIDSTSQKGVEYATVAILDNGGRAVNMVAADANGKFSLDLKQNGTFNLSVTSLGHSSHLSKIEIDGSQPQVDLGTIYLKSGIDIKEIKVAGQKPLITLDADKLTYSVETDPESQTSNVVDILRKIPQLSVEGDDEVKLNGQSNFKVLVNGKSSQLYSNNFKDVIRSMPASSIKDIEVITNPSSKYEAEGYGGIINIITSRRTTGYNGRISGFAGSFDNYGSSAYLAAQVGKFSLSTTFAVNHYGAAPYDDFYERENFLSDESRRITTEGYGGVKENYGLIEYLNLESSYEIDSLNLITLAFWGNKANWHSGSNSKTTVDDANGNPNRIFENIRSSLNPGGWLSGSLDYQKLYRKPDKSLTFSYKIDGNPRTMESTNDYIGILNYNPFAQKSWNKSSGMEHTGQIDFFNPLTKKHQIEMGVKYILRLNVSDSEIRLFDADTEQWILDDSRKNDMDYTQHIFGAYGGYLLKLKKVSFKIGARAEGTLNDGTAKTSKGNLDFHNTLFNLVPYVNLSFIPKPSHTIRLSYTQRLQRPGIWYLNPYVNDTDPLNISYGNPDLKSAVSHAFAANYSRFSQKWNFFLGSTASFSDNDITRFVRVNDNGVSEQTYDNIGKNQTYRLNSSLSYHVGVKFSLNLNFNASYTILDAEELGLHNEGITYGGNGGFNIQIWKDCSFRANGGMYTQSVTLYGSSKLQYYNSLGLSQKFFKKKLDINVNVVSPFERYMKAGTTMEDSTFRSRSENRYETRRYMVGLGYRFGKQDLQVKKARRTISNEDKMNGGESNSGGGQ